MLHRPCAGAHLSSMGSIAMITMQTWMFLSSFEKLRSES